MGKTSSEHFVGKRALVTGGNGGIGLEIVRALYKEGAHVIIADKAISNELVKEMPDIETVMVDLSDWKATKEAIGKILPIQLLVNNAGVSICKPFGHFEEADFDFVYSVNIKSMLNVSQVIGNDLKARKLPGSIVNISSVSSIRPLLDHAIYCSSKGAVDLLSAVMALELGPDKIRVNTVHPSITMTEMGRTHWSDPKKAGPMLARTPMGRFAEISDVVNGVMFLLSDESSYLTGVRLPVDGGLSRI